MTWFSDPQFLDPRDRQAFVRAVEAARNDANRLHARALPLGYSVRPTGSEVADTKPIFSFLVWPTDQTQEDGQTFETVEAVERHLDQLERAIRRSPERL